MWMASRKLIRAAAVDQGLRDSIAALYRLDAALLASLESDGRDLSLEAGPAALEASKQQPCTVQLMALASTTWEA